MSKCPSLVALAALLIGCPNGAQDGAQLVFGAPQAGAGGEAGVNGPADPVAEDGEVPTQPDTNCAFNTEWFHLFAEGMDTRMTSAFVDASGRAVVFGAADYPDNGWLAVDGDTSPPTEIFWDSGSYWHAPIVQPAGVGFIMAGTLSGIKMAVQSRTADGVVLWSTDVELPEPGPSGQTVPTASRIVPTPGGPVVVGTTEYSSCCGPALMVASLNTSGAVNWVRSYPDSDVKNKDEAFEHPIAAFLDDAGNVVVAAEDFQAGSFDLWLMAVDTAGDVVWETQHSGWERGPELHVLPHQGGWAAGRPWARRTTPSTGRVRRSSRSIRGARCSRPWPWAAKTRRSRARSPRRRTARLSSRATRRR